MSSSNIKINTTKFFRSHQRYILYGTVIAVCIPTISYTIGNFYTHGQLNPLKTVHTHTISSDGKYKYTYLRR